ncbi:uncharacterized protein LOC119660085 [Hermetia illucens]|uniref:uncharacterized protein LOC119660085 n=1 Tax=Hermetia illucens TaxID=343691 RepID=UPI0018CC7A52|nr:uncharacterized protein LOC119660085 [Hermetia illucens]
MKTLLLFCIFFKWILVKSKNHYEIHVTDLKFNTNSKYAVVYKFQRNLTHFDIDIGINHVLTRTVFSIGITHFEGRRRKANIFNRNFSLCQTGAENNMWHFSAAYISAALSMLLNQQLSCPFTPRNISTRSASFNSDLLPLSMFYSAKSYYITNASFFEILKNNVVEKIAGYVLRMEIVKV